MEFQRHFKPTKDQEEVYLPDFMIDGLPVYQMDRDDIDDEFEKITLEQVDQLPEEAKFEIKMLQDQYQTLEEKMELYQLERAYKRWF